MNKNTYSDSMKQLRFSDDFDEKTIAAVKKAKSADRARKRTTWIYGMAAAACVLLVVFGVFVSHRPFVNVPNVPSTADAFVTPNETDTNSSSSPIAQDENIEYVSRHEDKFAAFDTLSELNNEAEQVIVGKCISAETVFQNGMIYTLSNIQVAKVYKGNLTENSVIQIVEDGGRATEDVYARECGFEDKAFFDADSVSSEKTIVVGTDGHFPLEQGHEVMLFLCDRSGFLETVSTPLYTIVGGYDGKLFKTSETSYVRPDSSDTAEYSLDNGTLTIDVSELEGLA